MNQKFVEILGDEAVHKILRAMGELEMVKERQPAHGLMFFECESPEGARIFLGRFIGGKSLGWICYDMPKAHLTDPIAAYIRDLIEKTYHTRLDEQPSQMVAGLGGW